MNQRRHRRCPKQPNPQKPHQPLPLVAIESVPIRRLVGELGDELRVCV